MSAYLVTKDHLDLMVYSVARLAREDHGIGQLRVWLSPSEGERVAADIAADGQRGRGARGPREYSPNHAAEWLWELGAYPGDLAAIGRELARANIRSLTARYPQDSLAELPGYADSIRDPAAYTPDTFNLPSFDVWAGVLLACRGYKYQSCEHAEHETDAGWLIADALERAAGYALASASTADGSLWWSFQREPRD